MDNTQLQALLTSMQDPNNQGSGPQYQTASTQAALSPFFNSPEYQLLYGNNASTLNSAGAYSPTAAFQADPGFAYNQLMTADQMQKLSAAKGTLQSGPAQNALLTALQGNQNNQYQNWLGQQANLYDSYQNKLLNLSNIGMGNTGATQAYNNGITLAQLLGGYNMNAGNTISGANLATGSNISQILANQGVYNGNAYMNNAGAVASNMMNTFGMQQQMNNQQSGNMMGSYF